MSHIFHGNYILNEFGDPVPCPDLLTWGRWMETAERHVGLTEIDGVFVSTVFLGIDHSFGEGDPVLFETMIYVEDPDQWSGHHFIDGQMRYTNRADAMAAHEAFVAAVKEKLAARGGRQLLLAEGLGELDADDQEELPG